MSGSSDPVPALLEYERAAGVRELLRAALTQRPPAELLIATDGSEALPLSPEAIALLLQFRGKIRAVIWGEHTDWQSTIELLEQAKVRTRPIEEGAEEYFQHFIIACPEAYLMTKKTSAAATREKAVWNGHPLPTRICFHRPLETENARQRCFEQLWDEAESGQQSSTSQSVTSNEQPATS